MTHLPHGPSVAHPQPGLAHASRGALFRASVAQLATALTALLVFSAGAAVVLGLTHYLITSQAMDDAHALKAYTIAGGIIAGGAFLPFMHGKAKALLIIGIVAAEAFNIGLIAETTWRERTAAHAERAEAHKRDVADHAARVKARADAEARLTRAESAADAKEQARAADASKRDCKRECMAGHLEAVTAARAEVSAARTALAATPLAGLPPSLDAASGAGQHPPLFQHWDLAMAVLSSIGGNLIAIGLFSFAGALVTARGQVVSGEWSVGDKPSRSHDLTTSPSHPLFAGASDAHKHPRLPQILVADVSAADAVLLQAENDRALAAFKANLQTSQVLPESDLDVFRQRFLGPLPERHGPLVSERVPASVPPHPEPPKPGKRAPAPRLPANVVELRPASHPVIAALESVGGSVASNKELAALMGVSSGEATKRRGEVAGLLVEERDGKETRIRLRA